MSIPAMFEFALRTMVSYADYLMVRGLGASAAATIGLPVFLVSLFMCSGRVIFTGILSRLGTKIYAAHSLAFSTESLFYIPCVGLGQAIAPLAGAVEGQNTQCM